MRRLLPALTAATALTLAACGGGDDDAASAVTTTATAAAATANDADVAFAQGMIPHHEQAVEMAELALDPKAQASAEVRDLATRIQQAQDPEIQQLRSWLQAWGEEEMDMSGDMAGHSMDGMMSADDMAALEAATGPTFDKQWVTMMIEHHEGAIEMAETEQAKGLNPDAKTLAGQIIATQQAEIDEMTALLNKG